MIAHLQHVAGHRAFDVDRAGHDVHAGGAVVFGNRRVQIADRAIHHQVGRVAGVVGDRLGADQIAAVDAQRRRERGVEIPPVHVPGVCRQMMQRRHSAASRSWSSPFARCQVAR